VPQRTAGCSPAWTPWSNSPTATGSPCSPGLLRVRGDRLEATSLRHAWSQIDQGLGADLCYAAWCQ
jgi:hypothetical protein